MRAIEKENKLLKDILPKTYARKMGTMVNRRLREVTEKDSEPFEEKITRLTSELGDMFKKSHELGEEIKKQLGAIGYELE